MEQPRWATNSKKWRAREPDEEPNEKTDTTKPMETESNNDDGSTKDMTTNAKPNMDNIKPDIEEDTAGREERMKSRRRITRGSSRRGT